MTSWTFYPVFIGTILSAIRLTHIAANQHDKAYPRSLSELAAAEQKLLSRFRNILLFGGTLFAITLFGYIVPRAPHHAVTFVFSVFVILGEMLAGILPAKDKTVKLHEVAAYLMAVGMLALSYLFWTDFRSAYGIIEAIFALTMSALTLITLIDKKHFLFYELPFIFISHLSFIVAAIALHK